MEDESTEYKRSGSCNVRSSYTHSYMLHVLVLCFMTELLQFTQECVYKYNTAQYSFGEEDRETLIFSTDIYWHCESSKDLYIVV